MTTLPNQMPLPKALSDAAPKDYDPGMNAGLFYCRFVRGWHPYGKDENNRLKPLSFSSYTTEIQGRKQTISPAKDWVDKLHDKKVGDATLVRNAAVRQFMLADDIGGKSIIVSTDWHFATGLGNDHPVENGFAWHPTLGVPYLTGAAVKGLLRAWCEVWLDWKEVNDTRLVQWFGDADQSGELIFLDALPIERVTLKADVMTPHMGEWYEKGNKTPEPDGSNLPADWHSPVPVLFLVVDKGQSFQFSLAPRPGSAIHIDDVMTELASALEYLGAGAKTAAGYGHMQRNEVAEAKIASEAKQVQMETELAKAHAQAAREKEERRAAMTPLARELDEWGSLPQQRAEQEAAKWFRCLNESTPEDKRVVAFALKAFYEKHGRWSGGSKQHKEQIRKIKEVLNG